MEAAAFSIERAAGLELQVDRALDRHYWGALKQGMGHPRVVPDRIILLCDFNMLY
jgi:hypothetical protein